MQTIQNFREFWPMYLRLHADPRTRLFHYVGTTSALLCLSVLVMGGSWLWIGGALVGGYGFAWASHNLFEKNQPVTFRQPLYALSADLLMLYRFIEGHIAADLRRAGVGPRVHRAEQGAA